MAKPPGTKHSKPRKEPVTIDLDPKDVQRKANADEASAGRPVGPESPPGTTAGGAQPASTSPGSARAETANPAAKPGRPSTLEAESGKPKEEPVSPAAASAAGGKAEPLKPEPTKPEPTKAEPAAGPKAAAPGESAKPDAPRQAATGPERSDSRPKSPVSGGAGGPGGSVPPLGSRPASAPPPGRGSNALLAGIAGGLIALLLVTALQWAGVWPGGSSARESAEIAELRNEVTELYQALAEVETGPSAEDLDTRIAEAVEAGAATLRQRLEAVEQAATGAEGEPVDVTPLQARLDELEAAIASLGDSAAPEAAVLEAEDRLAEMAARIDALEAAAREAAGVEAQDQLSDIVARIETLETADNGTEELSTRIDALEQELAAIVSELGERADEPRAALVLAASALRAAIEGGGSFETELEIYAALAPAADAVAELGAHAASGVATNAELVAELPEAADRMLAAGRERGEADSFWDGLWQSARDLVTVRPIGAVDGDGVEAVVARLEAAIRAGDHDRALAEYDSLPAAARAAGADFMDRVRVRHQVDTLVDRALAQALRAS